MRRRLNSSPLATIGKGWAPLRVSAPPLRNGVPWIIKQIDWTIIRISQTAVGRPYAETLAHFYIHRDYDDRAEDRRAVEFLALALEPHCLQKITLHSYSAYKS